MSKVSTCLWFGKDAEAAARFYVSLVPNSSLEHIQRAPSAWPGGEAGDVILVAFTLAGQSFQALNGGTPANYGTAASISEPGRKESQQFQIVVPDIFGLEASELASLGAKRFHGKPPRIGLGGPRRSGRGGV